MYISLIINGERNAQILNIFQMMSFIFTATFTNLHTQNKSVTSFFDKINILIPVIDDNLKEICDEDLTMEEFDFAIKNMASDHSPGSDGITTNFHKHFWEEKKNPIVPSIN